LFHKNVLVIRRRF